MRSTAPQLKKFLVAFGQNLRRERTNAKFTQEQLAEMADLHPRVLQKLEAGETNLLLSTAARLQEVLGCPWTQLVPRVNPTAKRQR